MKKIIVLLMFVFFPILKLYTQNFEPIQHRFIVPAIGMDSISLSGELPYFQQVRFLRGTQWDSHLATTRALGNNQMDIYSWNTDLAIPDSTRLFIKMYEFGIPMYTHTWDHPDILNAKGIYYDPTLLIDTNKITTLQSRGENVFGFTHIRGRITNNPSDTNFHKLIIDGDSLIGQVILEEPWVSDELRYYGLHLEPAANTTAFNQEKEFLIFKF